MFMGLSTWGKKISVRNILDANEKNVFSVHQGYSITKLPIMYIDVFVDRQTKFLGKLKLWLNNSSSVYLLISEMIPIQIQSPEI